MSYTIRRPRDVSVTAYVELPTWVLRNPSVDLGGWDHKRCLSLWMEAVGPALHVEGAKPSDINSSAFRLETIDIRQRVVKKVALGLSYHCLVTCFYMSVVSFDIFAGLIDAGRSFGQVGAPKL